VLKNLDKLPAQDQPIVIYCASGHRGAFALAALRELGYTDVLNLGGGLGGWKKAELPVVTGKPADPTAGTAPVVDETYFKALDGFLSGLPEGFSLIKAGDLNAALGEANKPFVVDVRTAEEWTKDGYIDGSVNIPIVELFTRLGELPADKTAPIVILCKSGHRGALALMALQMNGYTNVRNLGGGLNAWVAAELPVVK
jgi:rhodanese-related sulfurtransferase